MKHLERIAEPMLITADAWRAWLTALEQSRHVEYPDGYKEQVRGMEIQNGVAVIPICGTLAMNLDPIEVKYLGMTDMSSVSKEIADAADDPAVHAIVFDIDSGGGTVNGTPELARQIADVSKPTFAYTATKACSCAYWIAAAADNLLCSPSATVGHVGAVALHREYTRMLEEGGVTLNTLQSDSLKTAGSPYVAMTDEQRAFLQDRVDFAANQFKAFVTARRPQIAAEDMQAQAWWGIQAATLGYVDALADTCAEVITLAGGGEMHQAA